MSCPSCSREVRVPDSLIGQRVKCPTCLTTFVAEETAPASPAPPPASAAALPAPETVTKERAPVRVPDVDESERRRRDFDDRDEFPRGRGPRFREGGPRADAMPHRGGLVLTFGILSVALMFMCWPLTPLWGLGFGLPAWIMGQGDLKKMKSGAMDYNGESVTKAGWVLGIVGTGLGGLSILAFIGVILLAILSHQ